MLNICHICNYVRVAPNSTHSLTALYHLGCLWGVVPHANFPDTARHWMEKRGGSYKIKWKKNKKNNSHHFRQASSGKLLRRSCDTDFMSPSRRLAVIGDRVSGCGCGSLLLLLLSFVPLSLFGGPTSAHPRRKLQTWLGSERLLQDLEDLLDLRRGEEVRGGKHPESKSLKAEERNWIANHFATACKIVCCWNTFSLVGFN